MKKTRKFSITLEEEGREVTHEIELPPRDVNEIALEDLVTQLLRLQPGESLSIPDAELEAISSDDLQRVAAIADFGILCGCKVSMNEVITTDPEVWGVTFLRRDAVPPLLEQLPPAGSA